MYTDLLVGIGKTHDPELGSVYSLQELGDGRIWTEEIFQRQSIVTLLVVFKWIAVKVPH